MQPLVAPTNEKKTQRVLCKLLIEPEVKTYEDSLRRKAIIVNQFDPNDDVLRYRNFVSRQNKFSGAWLSDGMSLQLTNEEFRASLCRQNTQRNCDNKKSNILMHNTHGGVRQVRIDAAVTGV